MKTGFSLLAAVTGSVLLMAGPAGAQELKLGALATLSGPGAAWGMAILSAAELAADEANAKSGLSVGGKHYKVTVVSYDDKYKPTDAVTGINRMIYEDNIHFVVGPLGSAPLAAILPITTENKVLTMTMAWAGVAMQKEYPYSFRPLLTSHEVAGPQLKWILGKEKVTHVAILGPNNDSGQATGGDAQDAYKAAGVANIDFEKYEADRTDFSPILTKLISEGVDAIDTDGSAPVTAGLIVKQARELGFKGVMIRTGGEGTADILKIAGKDAEGLYVHQPINLDDPRMQDYLKRYHAKYQGEMNAYSPVLYANVQALFAAMEKAGTVTDVDKIAQTMADLKDFETVLGKVNWTSGKDYDLKHQFLTPFYIGQVSNGKLNTVASCTFDACK